MFDGLSRCLVLEVWSLNLLMFPFPHVYNGYAVFMAENVFKLGTTLKGKALKVEKRTVVSHQSKAIHRGPFSFA